jgi:ParB family chromosome partitioning protein
VRQVEALAKERAEAREKGARKPAKKRATKDANTAALERRLTNALGLNVTINHRSRGGALHIQYRSLDQLDDIVRRLERG